MQAGRGTTARDWAQPSWVLCSREPEALIWPGTLGGGGYGFPHPALLGPRQGGGVRMKERQQQQQTGTVPLPFPRGEGAGPCWALVFTSPTVCLFHAFPQPPISSLRRVYVINKEICIRTVCAHEELLRGKGIFALSPLAPPPKNHSGSKSGSGRKWRRQIRGGTGLPGGSCVEQAASSRPWLQQAWTPPSTRGGLGPGHERKAGPAVADLGPPCLPCVSCSRPLP